MMSTQMNNSMSTNATKTTAAAEFEDLESCGSARIGNKRQLKSYQKRVMQEVSQPKIQSSVGGVL